MQSSQLLVVWALTIDEASVFDRNYKTRLNQFTAKGKQLLISLLASYQEAESEGYLPKDSAIFIKLSLYQRTVIRPLKLDSSWA